MSKCKHPSCAVEVTPPQSMCSWMCEVDLENQHARELYAQNERAHDEAHSFYAYQVRSWVDSVKADK